MPMNNFCTRLATPRGWLRASRSEDNAIAVSCVTEDDAGGCIWAVHMSPESLTVRQVNRGLESLSQSAFVDCYFSGLCGTGGHASPAVNAPTTARHSATLRLVVDLFREGDVEITDEIELALVERLSPATVGFIRMLDNGAYAHRYAVNGRQLHMYVAQHVVRTIPISDIATLRLEIASAVNERSSVPAGQPGASSAPARDSAAATQRNVQTIAAARALGIHHAAGLRLRSM